MKSLKKGFMMGAGIFLGLGTMALLAVTVSGTINSFSTGDVLSADLINENFASLREAIESIPEQETIVDADGTELGILYDYQLSNEGLAYVIKTDGGYYIRIWAQSNSVNTSSSIYFTSTDCSGQGYAYPGPGVIFIGEGGSNTDLYYTSTDATLTTLTAGSGTYKYGGSCSTTTIDENFQLFPASPNDSSVTGYSGFTAPLTIE